MSTASETGNHAKRSWAYRLADWVADWGQVCIDSIMALGRFSLFAWRTLMWIIQLPKRETIAPNFYQVGVSSLPVVALTGTFIGMVLAVQSYAQFKQMGLETRLGAVINMTLVRELGPVLAATMLAGRVGSAMAAELGTMRVTEQIDALASMGANPIRYLVFTASGCWESTSITIGRIARNSSRRLTCSRASSRASFSVRRSPWSRVTKDLIATLVRRVWAAPRRLRSFIRSC
jgi:hypothetical protein